MIIKNHRYKSEQWGEECKRICGEIKNGKRVIFTQHFRDSLKERELAVGEVYSVFKNGSAEIIQGHAPRTYSLNGGSLNEHELRVFYGKTRTDKVVHVVMALDGDEFKFVTVYFPSPIFFESDLKTLKKKFQFKELHF